MSKQQRSFLVRQRFMFVVGNSIFWLVASGSTASRAADETVAPLYASLSCPLDMPEFTRRSKTVADRWQKFEGEFGIRQPHPAPVLRPIQSAKYELDATLFAVDQFVDDLEHALSFEYRKGRWQSVAALEARAEKAADRHGLFGNARVKVDFDPLPGKTHFGVRVVIPFGN